MRQWEYAKIGRVLESTHPDLVQGIVNMMTPALEDTSLIKPMYTHFCQTHSPETDYMARLIFISTVLKLFCPSALLLNCRVTDCVNHILTKTMGYNHKQSMSYFISQSRAYIKNPNFRDKVEALSIQLKEGILEVA